MNSGSKQRTSRRSCEKRPRSAIDTSQPGEAQKNSRKNDSFAPVRAWTSKEETSWHSIVVPNEGTTTTSGQEHSPRARAAISGDLGAFDLSHVFQIVAHERKTGRLQLNQSNSFGWVAFHQGKITAAGETSRDLSSMLAAALYESGVLPAEDVAELRQLGASDLRTMVYHTLHRRYIDKRQLMESLYTWIEDIVCDLFLRKAGTYRFDVLENVDRYRIENLSIGYELLIMEATRRKDELQRMQQAIPPDMILVPSPTQGNAALEQTSPFADYAAFVIEHLDGIESVESLNRHPLCPDYRLYETLCILLDQRRVTPISPYLTKAISAAGSRMSARSRGIRVFLPTILVFLGGAALGIWLYLNPPQFSALSAPPEITDESAPFSSQKRTEPEMEKTEPTTAESKPSKPSSPKTSPQSAHRIRQTARSNPKPKSPQTRQQKSIPTKLPAENLLATMSEQLAEKQYHAALETYALLPKPESLSPWALICRQRALSALNKTSELKMFFRRHSVHDGEYYMAKATLAARQGQYEEGLGLAQKARNTTCEFIDENRVGRESAYIHAVCRWGIWNAEKSERTRKEALGRWFDVKYMYRSNQNHPRFKEANERIRILTQES